MTKPGKKAAVPENNESPVSFCDRYSLPEYKNYFIQFVDDAQWLLVEANSPIVRHAFSGNAPYALPESFGRSVSSVGSEEQSMHIQTSGVEQEFTLTKEQVLAGDYTVFTDTIADNLLSVLISIESTVKQSMQDQGALTRLDPTENFWDQLLYCLENSSLKFDNSGRVTFDHLRLYGTGDTRWATSVTPTEVQIQQWQAIVDRKRAEHFAKTKRNTPVPVERDKDNEQIQNLIHAIQHTEYDQFLRQYATPEYEQAQIGWIKGLVQFEILQSPTLAGYHQIYVKHGMHEVSSTGSVDGAKAYLPQAKIEIREHMPIKDALAGNYNKRFTDIKEQVEAIRPALIRDAVNLMKKLHDARGSESELAIVEQFDWDKYLNNLEQLTLAFDFEGKPTLPQVVTSDPRLVEMTEAQTLRLDRIIEEKWKENNARRTRRRRLSEEY